MTGRSSLAEARDKHPTTDDDISIPTPEQRKTVKENCPTDLLPEDSLHATPEHLVEPLILDPLRRKNLDHPLLLPLLILPHLAVARVLAPVVRHRVELELDVLALPHALPRREDLRRDDRAVLEPEVRAVRRGRRRRDERDVQVDVRLWGHGRGRGRGFRGREGDVRGMIGRGDDDGGVCGWD